MANEPGTPAQIVDAFLRSAGPLGEAEVRRFVETGTVPAALVIFEQTRRLLEARAPPASQPPAMTPVYGKTAPKRRAKKPGRKPGHEGARRAAPPKSTAARNTASTPAPVTARTPCTRGSPGTSPWASSPPSRTPRPAPPSATGWPVYGKPHWCWRFANGRPALYATGRSRGGPAPLEIFRDAFDGVPVTDFWPARYHIAKGAAGFASRTPCAISSGWTPSTPRRIGAPSRGGPSACSATPFRRLEGFSPGAFEEGVERPRARPVKLMLTGSDETGERRVAGRLEDHWLDSPTFLERPDTPPANSLAERGICPAVVAGR